MKRKLFFAAGFGTGFVLGSKQGRGPYERLQQWWQGTAPGVGMPTAAPSSPTTPDVQRAHAPATAGADGASGERGLLDAVDSTAPDPFGEAMLVDDETRSPRVGGTWSSSTTRMR